MTTLRRYLLVLALGFIATSAWTLEVRDVPRPARWSIDLTGRVPPSALARFDEIADQIKANHGGELALVVVSSLDGRAPRPFATDLFNQWGLGRKDENDGTLLFLALDDRSIELLLGSGIDDSLRQAASAEIIETVIIPRLRAADLASAVVEGAEQCAERIYRLPARAATPSPAPLADLKTSEPHQDSWAKRPLPNVSPSSASDTRNDRRGLADMPSVVFALLLLAGLAVGGWPFLRSRRPPRCCSTRMIRMSEAERGVHLTAGQRAEELVGSVTYTIWKCTTCQRTEVRENHSLLSTFDRCPKCTFRTLTSARSVISDATTEQSGSAKVTQSCHHCLHRTEALETIPVVPRYQTSYGSGRRTFPFTISRGTSSRGSSSSSSSSSRSFGGGRSSGRGASGKW